jgi:hypothetical protein
MRRFVHRENIKHYKQLLERTTDEAECQRILKLLAEEEAQIELDPPKKGQATG